MTANGARDVSISANVLREAPDRPSELEAVRQAAMRLLAGVPRPPATLRVQAGDVTLELSWPAADPVVQTPPPDPVPVEAASADHIHAPTVGMFYRAPEPGAPPFVEEGSVVAPGQQVAIVEAMKLMIPVTADRHGRIVEVLLADATAVEFGERLFAIAPVDPR
jgi:acetyl-CoA carboxylase biotin carboxyl carrier protein